MNERRAGAPADATDVKKAVIERLRSRPRKACFITELAASLKRSNAGAQAIERALGELEAQGKVIVRDHYCADPHLAGVDLRIVALVDRAEGADPQLSAIREIDNAWDKWLANYLANHRCG